MVQHHISSFHSPCLAEMFNSSDSCCLNWIIIMLLFALSLLTSEFFNWMNADSLQPPQKNPPLTNKAHPKFLVLLSSVGKINNCAWEKRRAFNEWSGAKMSCYSGHQEGDGNSLCISFPSIWVRGRNIIPFKHKRSGQWASLLWNRHIYDTEIRGQRSTRTDQNSHGRLRNIS